MGRSTKVAALVLPLSVVSHGDIMKLCREIAYLNETADQTALSRRERPAVLRASAHLQAFADANGFDMTKSTSRQHLASTLEGLKSTSPSVHVSFAADPSVEAVEQVLTWFRQKIDARITLQIGLQPSIVAGCIVRTANKVFDFSLRQQFHDSRDVIYKKVIAL
jgi:hypothetical protein